jgi:hypothetical protein
MSIVYSQITSNNAVEATKTLIRSISVILRLSVFLYWKECFRGKSDKEKSTPRVPLKPLLPQEIPPKRLLPINCLLKQKLSFAQIRQGLPPAFNARLGHLDPTGQKAVTYYLQLSITTIGSVNTTISCCVFLILKIRPDTFVVLNK